MRYMFFPGCSLESTAREFKESTYAVCKALNIELYELPDWTCCGSTPAHSVDADLSIALPAVNLAQSASLGSDLVTVCAACYSRLETANLAMRNDETTRSRIGRIIGTDYHGQIRVRHLLEVLVNDIGIETIRKKSVRGLNGLRIAGYYGCLLSRPRDLSIFPDPEAPMMLQELLGSLGAEVVEWPHSQGCCGGSFGITNRQAAERLCRDILDMAKLAGAQCLAAACPLCQSNLDLRQKDIEARFGTDYGLPVIYFTQLLGLALGLPEKELGLGRLFVPMSAIS